MKAIVYTKYGSPDVLELKEVDKPVPKDNEVLIKVFASTVTPMDWRFRNGKTIIARFMTGLLKPKNRILGIELASAYHPVTWARVKLLVERAQQLGWSLEADSLENEWQTIARGMSVSEDYHGFYTDRFQPAIRRAIDAMLIEAAPYRATDHDVSPSEWEPMQSTPVHLLNRAWSVLLSQPDSYDAWEQQVMQTFLAAENTG